jgi:hypothetical protein
MVNAAFQTLENQEESPPKINVILNTSSTM